MTEISEDVKKSIRVHLAKEWLWYINHKLQNYTDDIFLEVCKKVLSAGDSVSLRYLDDLGIEVCKVQDAILNGFREAMEEIVKENS